MRAPTLPPSEPRIEDFGRALGVVTRFLDLLHDQRRAAPGRKFSRRREVGNASARRTLPPPPCARRLRSAPARPPPRCELTPARRLGSIAAAVGGHAMNRGAPPTRSRHPPPWLGETCQPIVFDCKTHFAILPSEAGFSYLYPACSKCPCVCHSPIDRERNPNRDSIDRPG